MWINLVMRIFRRWFSISFLPLFYEFLLPLFSTGEIFRILRFLQRMPVIEDPIRRDHFSLESHAAGTVWDWKYEKSIKHENHRPYYKWMLTFSRNRMFSQKEFFFTIDQKSLRFHHVGLLFVRIESSSEQYSFISI